ncbi:TetR/AcrR family transcriptional regulator [Nocardioides caeni]|uniref:TetR/AcrR family transcriptional regulator n=1 Tax=Nocardioides caeni TaxID=574700 RepID=A0A4S8NL68_9ACTN|nr:TetR/AcrR family transcriptional regulator [Nocardioides caeni]THV17750.1 TetR/AcrR family transcriptional regulator [Nocardioides caeni]
MDPRTQRTREALLLAAERLFLDRRLDEVTLDEIAAAAGVAVGSVYNHFGSKAGLHAATVEQALEVDRAHMDLAYVEDRGPVDQIRSAAEQYLEFALAHPEHFQMLAFPREPGRYEAGRRTAEELADRVREQNDRLVAAIRGGIAAGELRTVDPELTATALWAAWNGIIGLAWRPDGLRRDEAELRELLRAATDLVERGLLAAP